MPSILGESRVNDIKKKILWIKLFQYFILTKAPIYIKYTFTSIKF